MKNNANEQVELDIIEATLRTLKSQLANIDRKKARLEKSKVGFLKPKKKKRKPLTK